MKRARERLDAQMEDIHKELLRLSSGGALLRPGKPADSAPADGAGHSAEKRITFVSSQVMASAFQLAGYIVATLALGRTIPATIVLEANAEYHVGRCSQNDLDTIWAVGDQAAARGCGEGHPRDAIPTIVIFKLEGDGADALRRGATSAAAPPDREQAANRILSDNWDDIVRVKSLLVERRTLSRAEIEAAVFDADAGA